MQHTVKCFITNQMFFIDFKSTLRFVQLSTFWSALYSTLYKESAHTHSIITNTPGLADGNEKLKNAAGKLQ